MRTRVRSLALLSGLRIRCCCELWYRLQMWLGSWVAMAVVQASSYSSNLTPSLGTSICRRCGPKKEKKNVFLLGSLLFTYPFFFFFLFLHLYLQHREVPGLGIKSELQLLTYATATATLEVSCICDLRCSLWQCWILNPLSEARDQNCILMHTMSGP